jgi:hypothetical protein
MAYCGFHDAEHGGKMPTPELNAPSVRISDVSVKLRLFQWVASGLVSLCIAIVILEHHLRDRFEFSWLNEIFILAIAAVLCPGVKWLWFRFVGDRLCEYSLRSKILWHLGALLLGEWLTVAIPLTPPYSLADGVGIGFIALIISAWLAKRTALASDPNVSRWAWLGYSLPSGLYWLYYLWAFWPTLISQDSVFQWNEMVIGKFHDDHPAIHTFTNWLITRAWNSPALIAIVQIVLLSLVIGLSLAWMRRHGMPRWLAVTACFLLAFSPTNAMLVITLWKDILYCTALVALVIAVLAIVQTDGHWLTRRYSWLWLAIPAIVVCLFRHNGPPVAVAVLFVLPIAFWRQWRPLLLSMATCAVCIALVKGPLYHTVGVQPVGRWLKAAPLLHQIAAHIKAKTPLKPEEQAVLNRVIPLEDGKTWPYNPVSWDSILVDKGFSYDAVDEQLPELVKIYFSLMMRRPDVSFEHWKSSSRLVWQVRWSPVYLAAVFFRDHRAMRYDPAMLGTPPETWIFEPSYVDRPLPPCIERSCDVNYHWLTWRPAMYMYLFFAGCVMAGIRSRNGKYLLVALPIFVQGSIMSITSISPDFRYHWGVYMTGILLSGYLLFAIPRREAKPDSADEETASEKRKLKGPHWQESDRKKQNHENIPKSALTDNPQKALCSGGG